MTITAALASAEQALQDQENPRLHARMLVASILRIPMPELYVIDTSAPLSAEEEIEFQNKLTRLATAEPFDYIVGYRMFCGLPIHVTPDVLIPRPETEELTQLIINSPLFAKGPSILEVGSGSGCIGVTLLSEMNKKRLPQITYAAIDKSAPALEISRLNYLQLLNLKFNKDTHTPGYLDSAYKVRLLNIAASELNRADISLPDIIVANPPYGTDEQMQQLPTAVKDYEPLMAISGGKDGLDVYRDIAHYISQLPTKPVVFLEIGPAIASTIRELFAQMYVHVEIKQDLFGRERFLIAST